MAKNDTKEERAARLADNLRANLRRRKQQARKTQGTNDNSGNNGSSE